MDYFLDFIGIYEEPVYREQFIQHIPEMINVKLTGKTEFVLADLKEAMLKQLTTSEQQEAVNNFIHYQLSVGSSLYTTVLTHSTNEEVTWVAFSLHKKN